MAATYGRKEGWQAIRLMVTASLDGQDTTSVVYRRDPLSVRFDRVAAGMITRAVEGQRRGRWIVGIIESGGHEQRERGGPGLSVSERAFQRSLYHDKRIHKARKGTGDYSLVIDWREVIGRRRFVAIRLFTDTSGARRVRRDYGPESYIKNPAMRSTFAAGQQDQGDATEAGRGRRGRQARHGA